ncbi:MAG TPA: hypothetical protein PKD00_02525 [Burkholderiales bacterium]|nr:hypothetical protein [Burkholderiales bacterium]
MSCDTTEDCPIGCECVSGTCQDPCNLLQVDCDAYLVHNENDLTLAYNYVEDVNGNYFEIIPSLGLEIFLFSPLNTTWQVNLDNYINGWVDISTTYDMNGGTAIEVSPDGTLKFYTDYFDNNYVLIQLEVAGRMVWYRLEFVSGGLDYNEENFEVGGVFLCREIFTVESLTGIDWLVSNWIVSDPDIVLYTSPTILVIDCPGAPQFEGDIISIVAEVYNEINDCEISTCEYEYECECFGTKNCEEYFIDIAQNFDTSTNIWTLAADILYDNGSFNEVVFTDCQLLHSLQEPTPYDCSRCGGVPYLSSTYMTGTGDNVAEFYVDIPICDNLTANDSNCEDCVCGFTFEGAELIWYNGSEIRILVTDVNNAQICYQTNALGSTVSGDPCCIQHCEPLIFPTGCNLAIEASIECETFGNYIITINTTGNLGNITTVIINEVSVDFTYANNVVVTEILNYNPDINLEITVIDSNDCIATTDIDTYCCALEYNVLPIACEDNIYGINCQSCENGNEQIIGYNINVNNGGIPYDINIETNFTNYNVVGVTGSSVYIIGNQYFFNSCHDLLITNMEIDILGCVTTVTSVCVSEDCYVGFWYSSGFNNSLWNSPTSQSYLDYEWTGVEVNNTFYDFTLLAAGGIDMKAIVCQAAYELSLGTCTDEIMSAACSTVATGTDCYTDLSTCGLGTGQSVLYNSLHDKIAEKLLDAWNCRLNSYIVSINNQLSALGEDPLVLFQYNQTSLIFAPELLPDSSLVNQSLYYKYFVSTTEKYPSGLIKPVRNTSYLTVKPIINLTCGDSPSDCNIGYNCEECNVVVLNGLFSTTGECITECVVLCENDYIVTPNIVSFDIMVVDPPLDPTGSTVISEPLDIYGILYNASAIQACTTYNIDDDQTVQEYGTLKLKFNFPSLPDCVNFTKATIDIVSEPSGKGFGIGLDTGTYYAPLYLDNTKNGVLIDYDSFAEGTIPVVITGVVDFYYQNNYELIYPADSYAPSGVLNTTYDVSLIGVTTNPLDWVLEIVGFSGGDTYGTCDILHSVTITLYTDCTECGNECFINPEIELICQEEDGDYNGQYNILIDEEFNSGSTYNLEYYDHENNLQQYLNILLPYEIDQDDNNIIANTSYNFTLTNNNTNCSAEVSVVPNCCLPTLTIQPYFCDTVTGASVYPMSMGFKINETFSGLGYTWIADIVSLNASFAPFSVVIDSDFIFVNELGVFDVSIPGITSGFNCEAPNSPINPTGTYNYDFVTNWATSEVQITFTVSGGAEDCTQVIDYTDFLCNNPEVDFPYGFTIESTNITCDLENDVLSVDIELYSDLSLSYVINVSGCSETTVYYESATPPTTNYNYTCLLYDNLPITITITNNSGCTETIVIPPQDITIDNVSFDCKTNIISFEILSPDNLLYYSCEECVNLSVSGTLMDTNPQTFFCDLDGLNPTGLTLVVSNDNDCFRTYDIDRSACVDECSNNPDLVIECEECGQSVFMASPFTQGFNEYDNLQYVIINDIPFIPETVIPPTGYTAVPMFPDDINYYLFEIFRDIVYAETGVLLVVNYDSLLKKGILYAIGPCCDSEISVLIKTVNLAVPDDILSPNNGFSLGANVTCNYIRNNIYEDFVCCSCFSAYPIGPVTNVSSDTIYWNYDNTDPDLLNWNEYTAGDCVINSVSGEIYFTREVTYTNSCRPSLLRYTFDTSTSTVTCNVMRSSFIARIINTSPFTIPSGTVFNLSWSGLGGATNFAGSFNGVINGAGTLFTTNTDILTNQQFRFAVAHNTTTCPGQTVILTVTTNDINIDPIIITLTT